MVGCGEQLLAGADLEGVVAPCGMHEPRDGPAGALLDEPGEGERGEHDAQVGLGGVALPHVIGNGTRSRQA